MADLRSAAAETHRGTEKEAAEADQGRTRTRIRNICAAAITGTIFPRTACGGRASTSNAPSSSTPPTRSPTRVLATHSARWPITAISSPPRDSRALPLRPAARSNSTRTSPMRTSRSGIERLFWGWDWPAAERELQTAIRLNPKLALAHSVYGLVLAVGGRDEEALQEVIAARELDPLSLFINVGVAWIHHFAGRVSDAMREALKTREIFPGFEEAGNVLISSYEALGRYEDAAAVIAQQRCWGVTFDGRRCSRPFATEACRVTGASAWN